jgi:hypothetical protein
MYILAVLQFELALAVAKQALLCEPCLQPFLLLVIFSDRVFVVGL